MQSNLYLSHSQLVSNPTRVKGRSASYLLWVKSMLGSSQGPSLNERDKAIQIQQYIEWKPKLSINYLRYMQEVAQCLITHIRSACTGVGGVVCQSVCLLPLSPLFLWFKPMTLQCFAPQPVAITMCHLD